MTSGGGEGGSQDGAALEHPCCIQASTWSVQVSPWSARGHQRGQSRQGKGVEAKDDGRQRTPTDDIAITLPREEANSCPQAYLMLWLREQQGQARGPLH